MFTAPVVAWEISAPPTTPRGTSRSSPLGCTTLIAPTLRPPDAGDDLRATPSRRHARELPAGDVEHLAVHEVGPRRAQEEDAARRLLRRARTPERDQHRRHPAQLVGDPQLHRLAPDLHYVGFVLGGRQPRLDVA